MGIALELRVLGTTVHIDLILIPLGLFLVTLVQFAYSAIMHYAFHDLYEAMDAYLYGDAQLSVSICMLDFVITLYLMERELVPMNAHHVRNVAIVLRVLMFRAIDAGLADQKFWVVLPSAVLAIADAAFYVVHFATYNHPLFMWPPRAALEAEVAYWDFPITRIFIFVGMFISHFAYADGFTAFLFVQPYLHFVIGWTVWGRNSWLHSAVLYLSTFALAAWCSFYSGNMTPYSVVLLEVVWRPITHLNIE